jgi:hypothetical protein
MFVPSRPINITRCLKFYKRVAFIYFILNIYHRRYTRNLLVNPDLCASPRALPHYSRIPRASRLVCSGETPPTSIKRPSKIRSFFKLDREKFQRRVESVSTTPFISDLTEGRFGKGPGKCEFAGIVCTRELFKSGPIMYGFCLCLGNQIKSARLI